MEEEEVAERLQHANSAADEGDGSLIIYTSGTTGRPKGKSQNLLRMRGQILPTVTDEAVISSSVPYL